VERRIVAVREEDGVRVVELSCLHVKRVGPADGGEPGIGSTADCRRCDRAELPDGLTVVRRTTHWDETTMPAALRRAHRVAAGRWGQLRVEQGQVRFRAATTPPLDVLVGPGRVQPIPPEVDHDVEPGGHARFCVEFLEKEA
jgi:tellurite resistance-related uncharacterized protein